MSGSRSPRMRRGRDGRARDGLGGGFDVRVGKAPIVIQRAWKSGDGRTVEVKGPKGRLGATVILT